VKFTVDAQLPKRLADALAVLGHDAIHTLSLPQQNRTADNAIAELADHEHRIVISKDADFVTSHILSGTPRYLLEISTGNLSNALLLPWFCGILIGLRWPSPPQNMSSLRSLR
jgi:predicted nuclease of predicted toxin-antitoxin system